MSISSLKFLASPNINAQVSSGVGWAFISVPQTIIFLFLAASRSIDLFLKPLVIINFNLKGLEVDAFKAQAHIDAMDFRGVSGLISKYFLGDEDDNVYGGCYAKLPLLKLFSV